MKYTTVLIVAAAMLLSSCAAQKTAKLGKENDIKILRDFNEKRHPSKPLREVAVMRAQAYMPQIEDGVFKDATPSTITAWRALGKAWGAGNVSSFVVRKNKVSLQPSKIKISPERVVAHNKTTLTNIPPEYLQDFTDSALSAKDILFDRAYYAHANQLYELENEIIQGAYPSNDLFYYFKLTKDSIFASHIVAGISKNDIDGGNKRIMEYGLERYSPESKNFERAKNMEIDSAVRFLVKNQLSPKKMIQDRVEEILPNSLLLYCSKEYIDEDEVTAALLKRTPGQIWVETINQKLLGSYPKYSEKEFLKVFRAVAKGEHQIKFVEEHIKEYFPKAAKSERQNPHSRRSNKNKTGKLHGKR